MTKFGVVLLLLVVALTSCLDQGEVGASPEAAKRFLKLRGYESNTDGFFAAINAGDPALINAFLTSGIDPNVKDARTGRTALITVAARGELPLVKILVQGKADVNAQDSVGRAALFHAIEARYDDVSDFLVIQPGLDLNARGKNGVTALISYVWRERADVVKTLLEKGANVNLQDDDGDTALHGAAQKGNVEIAAVLVTKGANPDAKNKVGGTPLMWAAVNGNDQLVAFLLKHADPNLKDNDGMTALDWARRNNRSKVVDLLKTQAK